jgi:hypothetical protein
MVKYLLSQEMVPIKPTKAYKFDDDYSIIVAFAFLDSENDLQLTVICMAL